MSIDSSKYLFLGILLCFSFVASAATDNFTISSFISSDVTPPSVPADLTATPIAATQIDLAWSSSTDNHILSGYQVFRDGSQIATATLTSYSDTGLSASTTYTYYVTAFDMTGNVSASSTEVATTTLALPVTPSSTVATSTTRYGTRIAPIEMIRLEIIPDLHSVVIRYETKAYLRPVIRWGKTYSYEQGSLSGQPFKKIHETKITGLTPGTKYYFTIEGETNAGRTGLLTESSFMTLPEEDIFPPGNVLNARAITDGDDIVLTWQNPTDSDFSKVRVMRGSNFYPSDTADGWLIYEGREITARDKGSAIPGTRQFYTIFSYDDRGNISSGAIVAIRITERGIVEMVEVEEIVDVSVNPLNILFSDLVFIQEGEVVAHDTPGSIRIDGTKALTVRLPYSLVPQHLKTILVSLRNPEGGTFSFLLRANAAKDAYTAMLAPFGIAGRYTMSVTVFDFKTTQIGHTSGELLTDIFRAEPPHAEISFIERVFSNVVQSTNVYFLVLPLLALVFLALFLRNLAHRRRV